MEKMPKEFVLLFANKLYTFIAYLILFFLAEVNIQTGIITAFIITYYHANYLQII